MLCKNGKISLYNFALTSLLFCTLFLSNICFNLLSKIFWGLILGPILYFAIVVVLLKIIYRSDTFQVAVRAALLGFIFGCGIYIYILASNNVKVFGIYMCVMSAFHYSEFLTIAFIQPKLLSTDSFVLNHSPQYTIAAVTSWVEFAIESYLFPEFKTFFWLSYIGLSICICGDLLRKTAMLTANSNFNHLVQCEKSEGHVLVTHGVYGLFRHPSYVGWFYWSISTQVILLNPLCFLSYAAASWLFFKERITIEELTLLGFFGQQYCDYQQKVRTGLPFIYGYKIKP